MRSRFEYILPRSLKEALDFLGDHGSQTSIIAGGTDLMIAARNGDVASRYVVDVSRLEEMRTIAVTEGTLSIGAAVTYTEIVNSPQIAQWAPILAQAAGYVGSVQIRNVGTLGGNVANASPAADSVPPLAGPSGSGTDSVLLIGTKRAFGRGYNWSVPHHSETGRSHNAIYP